MTTIDMLRHPSIRAVLTAAARIEPDLIPSTGLTPRPSFTVRNLPAGISRARAADLMEATAADAQHLRSKPDRAPWYRELDNRRADE